MNLKFIIYYLLHSSRKIYLETPIKKPYGINSDLQQRPHEELSVPELNVLITWLIWFQDKIKS